MKYLVKSVEHKKTSEWELTFYDDTFEKITTKIVKDDAWQKQGILN